MANSQNSMLFGVFEETYSTKFEESNNDDTPSEITVTPKSRMDKAKSSILNTVRKMNNIQDSLKTQTGNNLLKTNSKVFDTNQETDLLSTKTDWWNPPQDSSPFEFCLDTSLHGLKYIGQKKRHLSERIFWLIAFVTSLTVAIWLISEMWTKYKLNPVIVSFQPFETNVDQIPFPAVTVCNMNKVMRSKAEDFISRANSGDPGARRDVYYLDHVCSSTKSFAKRFNFTQTGELQEWQRQQFKFNDTAFTSNLTKVNEFLRKAAQNCTEMISLCVWQDQEFDCGKLFRPIETEFGKCCTANMVPLSLLYSLRNDSREDPEAISSWQKWDIDNEGLLLSNPTTGEKQFPRRQMKAGLTNGLSFLLNVNFREYYCTSSDSVGFRLATHLPVESPKIADFGISLRPNSEAFVDVTPQITMVDTDIYSFSLDQRNCYKAGEYKLKYYKYYSVNNCIDECIANDTQNECGCKRYYMPSTSSCNVLAQTMGQFILGNETETLCGPQKFACAEEVKINKTKNGIRNTCSMCLPSCTELNYEPQTTSTPMKEGIWKFPNGSSSGWEQDNLSIVHVYIGQDSFYAKVRKELYGPTDLFANTGGLMGLCLGFSGLSFLEVIYFLTLRAWWKARRKLFSENKQQTPVEKNDPTAWAVTTNKNKLATSTLNGFDNASSSQSYYKSIFGEIRLEEIR